MVNVIESCRTFLPGSNVSWSSRSFELGGNVSYHRGVVQSQFSSRRLHQDYMILIT